MTTVKITDHRDSGWVNVTSPFDPNVIATIKDVSPAFREWVPGERVWRVHGDFAERLTEALIASGHDVVGENPPPPPLPELGAFFGTKAEANAEAKAIAADLLAQVLPEMRSKVFREMAKQLYPDLYRR